MLLKFLSALFVFASCFFTNALHANEEASSIDIEALDWQGPGIYSLSQSHARVSIPEDCIAVFDQDAKKLHGVENPDNIVNLEALMYDKEATDTIIFEFFEEGYVAMDDWDNIDSKELLASIRENTEEANRKLAGTGIPSVHVRSWLREPSLNRQTNTVNWAFDAVKDDGEVLINAVAFKFGLKGYEKITLITDNTNFLSDEGSFESVLTNYRFEKGNRYSEYKPGDKLATYGIASLVAASVGGKLLKTGGILYIIKKAMIFIVSAIGAGLYKLRSYFKKK